MNKKPSLAELLEERAELDRTLASKLRKSILQEAIEGRLVPQDPNDEPASVLLQKIRSNSSKPANSKRKTLSKPQSPRMKSPSQSPIPGSGADLEMLDCLNEVTE